MKSILLIEDDELLGSLLQTKLIKEGYGVVLAKDGEEGLEALEQKLFDLVLLDIFMPRMNGRQFLERMRSDSRWNGVPVIVISNSGEPFDREDAKKLGVTDYLVKANFDPVEVIAKVRQQIGSASGAVPEEGKAKRNRVQKKLTMGDQAGAASGERTETRAEQAGATGNKARLLVVEDDEFLRELIVTKLANEGFDVLEAVDGEDGLRKIREQKPDLVLLDIILPRIDGFEVLKQLKADPAISSTPVLMLSNLGQQEDVERALGMGAKDYLIKAHFTPQEILERVKSVLSQHL